MWFDAFDTSYTRSGNTVTGWTNKSGNSSATGTTGVLINQATLNGKSSLRMSSGNLSIGSITYSTHFRNFFVVANFVNTQQLIVADLNTSIGGAPTTGYYGDIELNYPGRNGLVAANPSGNFGVPCILSLSSSTGNAGIWVTGNSQTITTNNLTPTFFPTGTAFTHFIGSAVGSDFYEVMVYDGIITSAQRQQFEGYLAQKWGLTANLPPGHPGLTQTIYTSGYNAKNPGIAAVPSKIMTIVPYGNYFPLAMPACGLWLDAADASTITYSSGTNLSQWRDKSGNGYIMSNNAGTTTVAANSLNSLNTVYTPSGTNTKITNFSGRTKMTLFIVGKCAAGKYLIAFNGGVVYLGNDSLLYMNPPSGAYLDITDSIGLTNSVVSNNTWFIFCIGYDNLTNSTANPYTINGSPVNGTNRATIATPRGTPGILADQFITNTLYINSANGTNSYDSDYTAELIYYNDTLSVSQRQQVEGYLAWKWGLQSTNLPVGHPYYSTPPIEFDRPAQVAGIPLQIKMSAIRVVQLQYSGTYTTAGNFFATFTGNGSVTVLSPVTINYFAIGGGGGGGAGPGGGGGAGGLQMGSMSLSVGTYNIVIGPGGPAHTNGSNTTFGTTLVVALGGGFGGTGNSTETGGSGGCGGGQGGGGSALPGTGTQGSNGGTGINVGGTGGGGVAGPGTADIVNTGGSGGPGILYNGSYYGGGGGGAPNHGAGGGLAGAGGLGGGGRGGQNGPPILDPVAGTPNTGGGGGGGRDANQYFGPGAAGGSGVFIISY